MDHRKSSSSSLTILLFLFSILSTFAAKTTVSGLGPTGIAGEIKGKAIMVSDAYKGSPAEGKLKKGDQIIGVLGKKFTDPQRDLSKAIDVAESKRAGGKLTLMLKGGKTATLTLPVLGSYAATAPFNCPKTDRIITQTADVLVQKNPGRLAVEILALMATGEEKYLKAAAEKIKAGKWMALDGKIMENKHLGTWGWTYELITLCEYYLLTKDKSVLPPIKSIAVTLAWGQDAKGLYGHRMSDPQNNFRLPGYGAMNQTTLPAYLGMLLAKKCGIQDAQLDKALAKTGAYVKSYAGKGSFPYAGSGPHSASYNNNGMSGLAAVCMEVTGNSEGTKFFSHCAATSFDQLHQGHASAFFNPLWTSLGASRSGPHLTAAYFQKVLYFHNLRRQFDGSWAPDWKPGTHDGVALLTYCMGRRALIITGREMDKSIWARKEEVDEILGLSKFDPKGLDAQTLVKLATNHHMPQIRRKAIGALGAHRAEMTPTYVKWLKGGNAEEKMVALGQYGWWIKPADKLSQLDVIGAILTNPDEPDELRKAAAGSIAYMGDPAKKYYLDILRLVKATDDLDLCKGLGVLSAHPFQEGLIKEKEDIELAYDLAYRLTGDRDQGKRGIGFKMLFGMPLKVFHRFVDRIDYVFKGEDPTWTSYSNPSHDVASAVMWLASLNIREGLDLCGKVMDSRPRGKHMFRHRATWMALGSYGGNAKEALKAYQKTLGEGKTFGRHQKSYLAMVKGIEDAKSAPKLISMKEAIAAGK